MNQGMCCGTCKYNEFDYEGQWCCINSDSEAYGLFNAYDDSCEEWEDKA